MAAALEGFPALSTTARSLRITACISIHPRSLNHQHFRFVRKKLLSSSQWSLTSSPTHTTTTSTRLQQCRNLLCFQQKDMAQLGCCSRPQGIPRQQQFLLRMPAAMDKPRFPGEWWSSIEGIPSWQASLGLILKASSVVCAHYKRQTPVACISSAVAGGSGGGLGGRGGVGGGGSGGAGGEGFSPSTTNTHAIGADTDDLSHPTMREDVIILDVGGMSCGGCASSVKRMLESQPQVTSATVNLATEVALVHVRLEPESASTSQVAKQQLGEVLAKHLTSIGFKTTMRDQEMEGSKLSASSVRKRQERLSRLKESGQRLAVAWTLVAASVVGHASHLLGNFVPTWLHFLHSVGFQMSLSIAALAGPGQNLLVDGWKSLLRRAPNMNTLVGLGAVSSFAVSAVAAFLPKLVACLYFISVIHGKSVMTCGLKKKIEGLL
ncbi:hypothetical protein O6H91_Y517100 [Diphasiastrum complanatum]|nr:hypothetical protein O6H91_Y517100 [Diphasiastrum complanatum]